MRPSEPGRPPDREGPAAQRSSFLAELKKRQVFQSALAYGVIAWGATEILDGVITRFGWPDWLATLVVILFVVGFPVAMLLAWVFDWTSEGIRRDEPWTAMDRASVFVAAGLLVAGTAGLFWLINPGGVAHRERVGVTVLPCHYRGPEEFAFRADGMAEAIEDRLALLGQLRVPAFSSVIELLAQKPSTAELGEQAGVTWLVECRLGQDQAQWQIEASLVDVSTDQSEPVISLEVPTHELFTKMDPVAQALVGKLGLVPTDNIRRQWARRSTSQPRSFDAYFKGELAMRERTVEGYTTALDRFRQAQEGPGFTLAKVREAEALMGLLATEHPGSDREIAARLRAVGLILDAIEAKDPETAELYAARMRLEILSARFGAGGPPQETRQRAWFEHALELRPSYAEPYRLLAEVLRQSGKEDESANLLASAESFDPDSVNMKRSQTGY